MPTRFYLVTFSSFRIYTAFSWICHARWCSRDFWVLELTHFLPLVAPRKHESTQQEIRGKKKINMHTGYKFGHLQADQITVNFVEEEMTE